MEGERENMKQIIDATTGEIISSSWDEINLEADLAEKGAFNWLSHVIKCGQLLIEQKAKLEHGEWLPSLMQYCNLRERQARRYMEVANRSRETDLEDVDSIRGVLRLLAKPSELKGTGAEEKPIQLKFMKVEWVRILAVLRKYPEYADLCEQIDKVLTKHQGG